MSARTPKQFKSAFASTAHRYWNEAWSESENIATYGSDASKAGIGSNFRIDLEAAEEDTSAIDSVLVDLKRKIDHQSLLEARATTLEQIALDLIAGHDAISNLRLWETERLFTTLSANKSQSLSMKIDNLTFTFAGPLDPNSRLIVRRDSVREAVHRAYGLFLNQNTLELEPWSEKLFKYFLMEFKNLEALRVDLGRHESIELRVL